jgi:hypothetical protein
MIFDEKITFHSKWNLYFQTKIINRKQTAQNIREYPLFVILLNFKSSANESFIKSFKVLDGVNFCP